MPARAVMGVLLTGDGCWRWRERPEERCLAIPARGELDRVTVVQDQRGHERLIAETAQMAAFVVVRYA